MALQHLRSSTAHKRPIPTVMSAGQIAINTNEASPGLFFKDSNGDLVKVGPVHIGTSAPNSSPDSVAATALVTGTVYQILTVGTSDFTLVGASANTVGTVFTATGTTTGTGTVSGQQGNEKGEQWLDTTGGAYDLKIYDGSSWRSQAGEFVNVTGDTMTGALLLDNAASASAPDLSFDGDANTGIYSPGSDQFGITTGGTAALTVDSSQRVGIGITSPNYELHVHDASGSSTIQLTNGTVGSASTDGARITGSTNGILYFENLENAATVFTTNNTERLRIDSSGRLLVGTSTSRGDGSPFQVVNDTANPIEVFRGQNDVYGPVLLLNKSRGSTGSPSIAGHDDQTGAIAFKAYDGSSYVTSALIRGFVDGTTGTNDMPGRLVFSTTADGASSPTERMRIDSSGRLLVGTTTPGLAAGDKLTLAGSGNSGLTIRSGSTSSGSIYFSDGTAEIDQYKGLIQYTHNGDYMRFLTANTERMRIDSSGKVGIGTTSPGSTLELSSAATSAAAGVTITNTNAAGYSTAQFKNTDTSGRTYTLALGGSTSVFPGSFYLYDDTAGTSRVLVDSSGRVGIGTASPQSKLSIGNAASTDSGLSITFTGDNSTVAKFFASTATGEVTIGGVATNYFPTFHSNGSEAMRIDSSGNVGIGTASPSTKLSVINTSAGSIASQLFVGNQSNTNGTGAEINFSAAGSLVATGSIQNVRDGAGLYSLRFKTFQTSSNAEAMRIDGSGRLLLGTTTEGYAGADTLTIGSSANAGITVRTGTGSNGSLAFSDGTSGTAEYSGLVQYRHADNSMNIFSDGVERVRIANNGYSRFKANGVSTLNYGHEFADSVNNSITLTVNNQNASFQQNGGGMLFLNCARAASSSYTFLGAYSSNVVDREYNLRGDGNAFADGAWGAGGADYAEYFEWSDGNLTAEDRRGISVVLDGDKIREAVDGEDPIGVISGNPSVVGDAAWNKWIGKYLRDDFGAYIQEDYEVEDDDGNTIVQQRRKLNPDYNDEQQYVSREDRPEWDCVGLMGKLRIRKGQVTGSRWIKMRDISDSVEEWLVR